jgi:glutamate decarboxylase
MKKIQRSAFYRLVTTFFDVLQNYEEGLPVVAFRFSDNFQETYPEIQQKWIQILLRAKGWIVPNYELAPDLEKVQILRVVVKENTTEAVSILLLILLSSFIEAVVQLVDRLLEDIVSDVEYFDLCKS